MTIGTRLYTFFKGSLVGSDEFGNRYFQEKSEPKDRRRKRWVMFQGMAEASKVPAHWHGWLHYTSDTPPETNERTHDWQQEHVPNLTGTQHAYAPPGHTRSGGKRYRVSSDYEPWTP